MIGFNLRGILGGNADQKSECVIASAGLFVKAVEASAALYLALIL